MVYTSFPSPDCLVHTSGGLCVCTPPFLGRRGHVLPSQCSTTVPWGQHLLHPFCGQAAPLVRVLPSPHSALQTCMSPTPFAATRACVPHAASVVCTCGPRGCGWAAAGCLIHVPGLVACPMTQAFLCSGQGGLGLASGALFHFDAMVCQGHWPGVRTVYPPRGGGGGDSQRS